MKKVLEQAKESKFFTIMSVTFGAFLSVHPVYYLAISYFVCAMFNILFMTCVLTGLKIRGKLSNSDSIVSLAKEAWSDCLEILIALYCVSATIGYLIGKLFIVVF